MTSQLSEGGSSASSSMPTTFSNGSLFREYIGAQTKGVTFKHIHDYLQDPKARKVDKFDMILAFAVDYDLSSRQPTTGVFTTAWDTNLKPDDVIAFKEGGRAGVRRVMLSIGGDTVQGYEDSPVKFTPATRSNVGNIKYAKQWIENAVRSLAALMAKYHLDGIDINYEHFEGDVEDLEDYVNRFVYCIKALLQGLREKFPDMVTSIAPHYGEKVEKNYHALWESCWEEDENKNKKNLIDYVNFQFYSGDKKKMDKSLESYANTVYKKQVDNYPGTKVLAGVKTAEVNDKSYWMNPYFALKEMRRMHEQNILPGIFFWSADSSFDNAHSDGQTRFPHEIRALRMLNSIYDDHC